MRYVYQSPIQLTNEELAILTEKCNPILKEHIDSILNKRPKSLFHILMSKGIVDDSYLKNLFEEYLDTVIIPNLDVRGIVNNFREDIYIDVINEIETHLREGLYLSLLGED